MAKKLSALATPELRGTMELLTKNQLIDALLLAANYPAVGDACAVQYVQRVVDSAFVARGEKRVNLAAAYATIAERCATMRENLRHTLETIGSENE